MASECNNVQYIGKYETHRPMIVEWSDELIRHFMSSTIHDAIETLINKRLRYRRGTDGFHVSDTMLDSTYHGGPTCNNLRKVSFTNCVDQDNYHYISLYIFYYPDHSYACRVSHDGDIGEISGTIGSILFPQIKSAQSIRPQ